MLPLYHGEQVRVLQAPMAGVSTPEMVAAVCEAGGLGGLPIGHLTVEGARAAIRRTRELTSLPFNVNLFAHAPARVRPEVEEAWAERLRPHFAEYGKTFAAFTEPYAPLGPELLRMLVEEQPAVVSFHFGPPPPDYVRELTGVLLGCATSLAEARQLDGVDYVVAQGYEAGGHRGVFDPLVDEGLSTAVLTRLLARERPVIAAGGVMDAAGVRSVLALGAVAAQVGTAYLRCPESLADEAYRAALRRPGASTLITRALSGRPARCLVNRFTAIEGEPPDYPRAYSAGKALAQAARAFGEGGYGAQWAGQGFPLGREVGAAELTSWLRS